MIDLIYLVDKGEVKRLVYETVGQDVIVSTLQLTASTSTARHLESAFGLGQATIPT